MSIIGLAATALIPGAGLGGAIAKWGVKLVFGKIFGGLKSAAGFLVEHWKLVLPVAIAAAALVYILILHGDLRHDDKIIASQATLIGAVHKEVDRGVGKPTDANNAPTYIHGFVDNLATVTAALDRQNAALLKAQQDANDHVAAAHAAAQPTQVQQQREQDRQTIIKGTGALTAQDWGKL